MLKNKNYAIIYKDKVTSSNDDLKSLLKDRSPDREVFLIAAEQTDGRGQFDRKWLSHQGKGLYLSYLYFPPLERLPLINKEVALIIIGILKAYDIDAKIKLPNDIYVKGNKIAGILTESVLSGERVKGVVTGIGLNLFFERSDFEGARINGTSMALETGIPVDRNKVAEALIEGLRKLNIREMEEIENEFEKHER